MGAVGSRVMITLALLWQSFMDYQRSVTVLGTRTTKSTVETGASEHVQSADPEWEAGSLVTAIPDATKRSCPAPSGRILHDPEVHFSTSRQSATCEWLCLRMRDSTVQMRTDSVTVMSMGAEKHQSVGIPCCRHDDSAAAQ